jgi:release factor glutamine methyltransferase
METFASLIQKTATILEAANIETPRREARLLVALAAELDTAMLIAREKDQVSDAGILARLESFTSRRAAHEPFAHIARRRAFYGLDFISDARALVPRPDSEVVVETALRLLPRGGGIRIADLGTGSACLLCAILHERGGVTGTGVECDPQAAGLARENIKRLGLEDRADIYLGDWSNWRDWGEVDLIVSNPPYIAREEIAALEPDVRLYDPIRALDGGPDGLDAYRQLVRYASKSVKTGAWLVFEIGYDQDQAVRNLLQAGGFAAIDGARDLGGNNRVVFAQK